LLLVKLPALFLNPWVRRRSAWPDRSDPAPAVGA